MNFLHLLRTLCLMTTSRCVTLSDTGVSANFIILIDLTKGHLGSVEVQYMRNYAKCFPARDLQQLDFTTETARLRGRMVSYSRIYVRKAQIGLCWYDILYLPFSPILTRLLCRTRSLQVQYICPHNCCVNWRCHWCISAQVRERTQYASAWDYRSSFWEIWKESTTRCKKCYSRFDRPHEYSGGNDLSP